MSVFVNMSVCAWMYVQVCVQVCMCVSGAFEALGVDACIETFS